VKELWNCVCLYEYLGEVVSYNFNKTDSEKVGKSTSGGLFPIEGIDVHLCDCLAVSQVQGPCLFLLCFL
jgi:hypothetical protein